jgi:hypothetical protein
MHIGYWRESQKETDHQANQDLGERIILKWILERYDGMVTRARMLIKIITSTHIHKQRKTKPNRGERLIANVGFN